jgi:hypothetical protein
MSRNIIYVVMYHHHKLLDLMNSRALFLHSTKTWGLASKLVIATTIVLFTADLTVLFITKK